MNPVIEEALRFSAHDLKLIDELTPQLNQASGALIAIGDKLVSEEVFNAWMGLSTRLLSNALEGMEAKFRIVENVALVVIATCLVLITIFFISFNCSANAVFHMQFALFGQLKLPLTGT